MRSRTLARELALQLLYEQDVTGDMIQERIDSFTLDWSNQKSETYEYARHLVSGVMESRDKIDSIVSKLAEHWAIRRMPVVDRNILRIGSFELMNEKDVPPKVVINEAVEIAKKYGSADSGRFVNAILDRMHKEREELQKDTE